MRLPLLISATPTRGKRGPIVPLHLGRWKVIVDRVGENGQNSGSLIHVHYGFPRRATIAVTGHVIDIYHNDDSDRDAFAVISEAGKEARVSVYLELLSEPIK